MTEKVVKKRPKQNKHRFLFRRKVHKSDSNNLSHNVNDSNQALIAGSCLCGRTYLMMEKMLASEVIIPDRKTKVLPRYPNQNLE